MAGLTGGGLAFAVFCATWTLLTAFLATLVAFVYIRSRKTIDFISLLSLTVFVAMFSSFLQQVYTYSHWDVVKEQERLDSMKEGAFFDVGSNGIIKAFYYIQILCYNIGGTLIAFWAFFLWASIQPLAGNWWRSRKFTITAKSLAVVSACTLFGISQAEIFSDKHLTRFLIANVQLILVLALTPFFLIMIVQRFVSVRIKATGGIKEMKAFPVERSNNSSQTSGTPSTQQTGMRKSKIRTLSTMLFIRFAFGVVVMSGLEVFHICFQLLRISTFTSSQGHAQNNFQPQEKTIPLTTGAQIIDMVFFLPSTSQGWLLFLVFGTTEEQWGDIKTILSRFFCFCFPCVWRSTRLPTMDSSSEIVRSPRTGPAEWIDLKGKHQYANEDLPYDGTNPPTRSASFARPTRNSPVQTHILIRNEINSSSALGRSNSQKGTIRRSDLVKPLPVLPGMQMRSYPQRGGGWIQGSLREPERALVRSESDSSRIGRSPVSEQSNDWGHPVMEQEEERYTLSVATRGHTREGSRGMSRDDTRGYASPVRGAMENGRYGGHMRMRSYDDMV